MRYFTKHRMVILMLLLLPIYLISCSGNSTTSIPTVNAMAVTRPGQPSGMTAVGLDSRVTISWAPPAGATSYNLYWNMTGGLSPLLGSPGSNRILNISLPFDHRDLVNGKTYYYRVSALNTAGESTPSAEVKATPMLPFTKIMTKLTDPDKEVGDLFGYSVAIDGNYAIIGAPLSEVDDVHGTIRYAGAAYIFHRSDTGQWDPAGAKLKAPDAVAAGSWAKFGTKVSISGEYVIVGAPIYCEMGDYPCFDSPNPYSGGAAYVFHRTAATNSWDAGTKLNAPGPGVSVNFGYSVSISGDYAVVGDDRQERVFVFQRTDTNTWDIRTMLPVPPSQVGDYETRFGRSVAISGDYVIVSADLADTASERDVGAAYIFHRTGTNSWDEFMKIMQPDWAFEDRFGTSVAMSGDYAIVGTTSISIPDGQGNLAPHAGAAYIFHRVDDGVNMNFWDEGPKIVAPDAQNSDHFGKSVAITDKYALVGAYEEDCGWDENFNEGAAYIYERLGSNSWDRGTKITIPTGDPADYYGFAVGISGESAIIGAMGDDGSVNEVPDAGAAYLY